MKFINNKIVKLLIILVILIILLFLGYIIIKYYFKNQHDTTNEGFNNIIPSLSSCVIIGTARDIEKYLPKTFEKIQMIRDCFIKSHVIIYENDSKDKTLELLKNWAKETPNVEIITEKNVPGLRTHRLAHGRTIVMNKAIELNPEYVIVMDLDDVNEDLTKDGFMSSFNYPDLDWAVMTANQSKKYYDPVALRTYDDWMPFDPWKCKKETGDDYECETKRFKHIPVETPPILVKSAFAGLGIYKRKYLDGCVYDGGKDSQEICEHVSFNEAITNKGGKIYINPKMINFIGYVG